MQRAMDFSLTFLLDEISDLVFVLNEDEQFTYVNNAWVKTLGYTSQEAAERSVWSILSEDSVPYVQQALEDINTDEDNYSFLLSFLAKSGREYEVEGTFKQVVDQEGSSLIVGVFSDVTERIRLRDALLERRRALHLVISSMPNILLLSDDNADLSAFFVPAGELDLFDPSTLEIGASVEGAFLDSDLGSKIDRIVHQVAESGEQVDFEHTLLLSEDDPLHLSIRVLRVVDADDILIVIDNVTTLRKAEGRMRMYADELEERNNQLDAYNFNIAHELKNPLNLILGYSDLLMTSIDNISDDQLHFSNMIMDTTKRMNVMIEGLLLLSRLKDTSEVLELVDMNDVISDAVVRFDNEFRENKATIKVDTDLPAVMGVPTWLEEVFANLVGNAIKYGFKEGEPARIEVRADETEEKIKFTVKDHGPGIEEEHFSRLFDMFSRFHRTKAQGSGLGLAIVKRIVEKLEGEIGVSSTVGEGAEFWFSLPNPSYKPPSN